MLTARPAVALRFARRRGHGFERAITLLSVVSPVLLGACSGPDKLGAFEGLNRPVGGAGGGGGQSSVPRGSGAASSGGTNAAGGRSTGGGAAVPDAGENATDGGSGAGGLLGDGGPSDSGAPVDAGTGAGPSCAGVPQGNVCWYLSGAGQSCNQACQAHGGFDVLSLVSIGIPAQGGSVERCSQVLSLLLGNPGVGIQSGTRNDVGVGCHVFPAGQERWWLTQPPFDPAASLPVVQVACGCNE